MAIWLGLSICKELHYSNIIVESNSMHGKHSYVKSKKHSWNWKLATLITKILDLAKSSNIKFYHIYMEGNKDADWLTTLYLTLKTSSPLTYPSLWGPSSILIKSDALTLALEFGELHPFVLFSYSAVVQKRKRERETCIFWSFLVTCWDNTSAQHYNTVWIVRVDQVPVHIFTCPKNQCGTTLGRKG